MEQLRKTDFISSLPSISLNHLHKLPAVSAVYFALDEKKKVWYTGQAKNLKYFFSYSHKEISNFRENNVDSIAYWVVEEKESRDDYVQEFIKFLDPPLNKKYSRLFVPALDSLVKHLTTTGLTNTEITRKANIRRTFTSEMKKSAVTVSNIEKILLCDYVNEEIFEEYFISEIRRLWKLYKEQSDDMQESREDNNTKFEDAILDEKKKITARLDHEQFEQAREKEHQSPEAIQEIVEIQEFFNPENIKDARVYIETSIAQRQGQPKFRRELLAAYQGQCAITGFNAEKALEAAHICPYKGDNTNKVWNGLLLRSDIHTLFDLYLITVHPVTQQITIAPELKNTNYSELKGRKLRLPEDETLCPRKELLEWHYKQCQWV